MQSPLVWQSRLGSLRVSWHLPWFPYLLPLSGGWSNSSGDESVPGLTLGCSSWHCVQSPCQLGCRLWLLGPASVHCG